jgi:hypothetical protein
MLALSRLRYKLRDMLIRIKPFLRSLEITALYRHERSYADPRSMP